MVKIRVCVCLCALWCSPPPRLGLAVGSSRRGPWGGPHLGIGRCLHHGESLDKTEQRRPSWIIRWLFGDTVLPVGRARMGHLHGRRSEIRSSNRRHVWAVCVKRGRNCVRFRASATTATTSLLKIVIWRAYKVPEFPLLNVTMVNATGKTQPP